MATLLFVYGTLKRGGCNHHRLADQSFVGPARTCPGFTLYDLGGYPGIVAAAPDAPGVMGEVWSVDAAGLAALDAFEGVPEGLYRREPLALLKPYDGQRIDAYIYARDVRGRPLIGSEWTEPQP